MHQVLSSRFTEQFNTDSAHHTLWCVPMSVKTHQIGLWNKFYEFMKKVLTIHWGTCYHNYSSKELQKRVINPTEEIIGQYIHFISTLVQKEERPQSQEEQEEQMVEWPPQSIRETKVILKCLLRFDSIQHMTSTQKHRSGNTTYTQMFTTKVKWFVITPPIIDINTLSLSIGRLTLHTT